MGILEAFSSYYWAILFVTLIYYTVKLCCRISKIVSERKNSELQSPRGDGPAMMLHDNHGQTDFPDSKNTKACETFEIEQLQLALKASAEADKMRAMQHIANVLYNRGDPMAAQLINQSNKRN